MWPASGYLEDPISCSAQPLLAGHYLFQKFLHKAIDAGITFRGVDLRLANQIGRKMKGQISCAEFHAKTAYHPFPEITASRGWMRIIWPVESARYGRS